MSNIDTMPAGREMDALVAEKVMGWADINSNAALVGGLCDDKRNWKPLPFYSTDIAAAWEVVEKIKGNYGNCRFITEWVPKAKQWSCGGDGYDCGWGKTAPLAICRAALKAGGL